MARSPDALRTRLRHRVIVVSLTVIAVLVLPYIGITNYVRSREPQLVALDLASHNGFSSVAAGFGEPGGSPVFRLEEGQVQFEVPVRHPDRLREVDAQLRFRPDLGRGQQLQVGIRNPAGNISWVNAYGPLLQGLATEWNDVAQGPEGHLYQFDAVHWTSADSLSVERPPPFSRISSSSNLYEPSSPGPSELPAFANRSTHVGVEVLRPLRGNHAFWTYVDDGHLNVSLTKQDLNFYADDDVLTVRVTTLNGTLLSSATMPDLTPGYENQTLGRLQFLNLTLGNLSAGSYRIALEGSGDYLLRRVQVSEPWLVAESVVLFDFDACCSKNPAPRQSASIFYDGMIPGNLTAVTFHNFGRQTIPFHEVATDRAEGNLNLTQPGNRTGAWRPANSPVRLALNRLDASFTGPGYFSFTQEAFFFPLRNVVVKFSPDLDYLKANVDFVHVKTAGFEPLAPADENGFYTWSHRWTTSEIGTDGAGLRLFIQVTYFGRTDYANKTVHVKDLEFAFFEKPFLGLGPWAERR